MGVVVTSSSYQGSVYSGSEPLSFPVDVSVGLAIDCPSSLCGLSVEHDRIVLKPIDKI